MNRGIVTVDIGGSHISSAMLSNAKEGNFITPFQYHKVDSKGSASDVIKSWLKNIESTIASAPSTFSNKVAIAMPGPFDYENGIAHFSGAQKYASLNGIKIAAELNSFSNKNIQYFFENDAACFALGEAYFGQAKNFKKIIAITLGTGIGCAFVENGKVIKAGPRVPNGGEVYHLPFREKAADDYFSTRWFVNEAFTQYDLKIEGVKELVAKENETISSAIFHRFSHNFFEFLLPLASRFGAEAIVFGGNISKAWSWFAEDLERQFSPHGISIFQSHLNEKAICLGAAKAMESQLQT